MNATQGVIGKNIDPNKPIHIIGAGISGLLLGYFLKKEGFNFTIYEKEKNIGGKIGTKKNKYGLAEKAANAIFTNDDVIELLDEIKLSYYPSAKKLKKIIWRKNKIFSPPVRPWEMIKLIPRLFKRPPSSYDMSVYNFFEPFLGKELCSEVLAPVMAGIYADDIKNLHFLSVFKTTKQYSNYLSFFLELKGRKQKQKSKSMSVSFEFGMQSFIDKLYSILNDHIKVEKCIEKITDIENTIICTDAQQASDLTKEYPTFSNLLAQISYSQITTATLITKKEISFLKQAFGILFPPTSSQFNSLGILSNSEIFPKRVYQNSHSYTFILKGTNHIEEKIEKDLSTLGQYQLNQQFECLESSSWPRAIPRYNLERYQAIQKLSAELAQKDISLAFFGNYTGNISIREILSSAKSFSQQLVLLNNSQ